MGRGDQILRGVVRWGLTGFGVGWLFGAIGIGCLYGNCVGGLPASLLSELAAPVASFAAVTSAVFAVTWLMLWSGNSWLIKWIIGAGLLVVIAAPKIVDVVHWWKSWKYSRFDINGPLPLMADRTPIVLITGHLSNCSDRLERYVKAWAKEGVLVVELRSVTGVDFGSPVALADLPLELHFGNESAADNPDYDGPYKGLSYQVRKLEPAEKQAASAEIDYVILAKCLSDSEIFEAFRDNPALRGTLASFEVDLAMAPLEQGSGVISIRDLQFDLLDLYFPLHTKTFFSSTTIIGHAADPRSKDPALLMTALCTRKDGTPMPGCND